MVAVMRLFLFIQEFYDNDSFFLRKFLVSIDCFYKLALLMTKNTLVYLLNTAGHLHSIFNIDIHIRIFNMNITCASDILFPAVPYYYNYPFPCYFAVPFYKCEVSFTVCFRRKKNLGQVLLINTTRKFT